MRDRSRTGTGAVGDNEEGSVLLLTLGYVLLALAVIFVCVCATDLYIAQKRLDALADSAALAGADGFTLAVRDGSVRAELTDDGVEQQAVAMVSALPGEASIARRLIADWYRR